MNIEKKKFIVQDLNELLILLKEDIMIEEMKKEYMMILLLK
jgi:hypothetical protein